MPPKPWYKVVTPREGKPLDAAEFVVQLGHVRNNCAPPDYQKLGDDTLVAFDEPKIGRIGAAVLDRVHQSMILFVAARGEALRRFLVKDGGGKDGCFWTLAQALSALYPSSTDEKRWVDRLLARKKGLGF